MDLFKKFRFGKYFRFLFFCSIGVISTLFHFLIFNLFRFSFNFPFTLSLIFAIILSMIFNFSVNRNITFSARRHSLGEQIPRYLTIYGISSLANFITSSVVKNILSTGAIYENLALVAGLAVSIPINFFGSLLWAFKKKSSPKF